MKTHPRVVKPTVGDWFQCDCKRGIIQMIDPIGAHKLRMQCRCELVYIVEPDGLYYRLEREYK